MLDVFDTAAAVINSVRRMRKNHKNSIVNITEI